MAGRSAVLNVRIVSDASQAAKGFQDAERRTKSFSDSLDRMSVGAGVALASLGLLGKQAFDAASDLQQSTGAVESVFGAYADTIQKKAAEAAQAVGLSTNSYQELAGVLGSQLKNMGYAGNALTDQTDSLIQMGADLAATFGGTTADAVEALSSLLRGERDPIERYGIAMNQAAVDAKVAALGLDTTTPAAERAAQAQATLAIVTEQSAAAHGAFGREADTAAGQTQRAAAEWENASAALGQALLPLVTEAAQDFAAFAGWLSQNRDIIIPLIATIGGMAIAILAVNGAVKAYTAVQAALDLVLNASPLMRLVMVFTLIVGAVVYAYEKFGWFRDLISDIGDILGWVWDRIQDVFNWIGDRAQWVSDLFSAPMTVQVNHSGAGGGGMVGAPAGFAPVRASALGSGAGGGMGPAAGPGQSGGDTYVFQIDGALDPNETAKKVQGILDRRDKNLGRKPALRFGNP